MSFFIFLITEARIYKFFFHFRARIDIFDCMHSNRLLELFKNKLIIEELSGSDICYLLEKAPRIRKTLNTEAIKVGVQIHPYLYKCLEDQSVEDFEFLSKLPCSEFKKVTSDSVWLKKQKIVVLENTLMLQNITLDNGNQVDLFECLGKKQAKELINDYDLVKSLSRDIVVNIMNRKCCEFFDKQTTIVALKAHPGKFFNNMY